MNECTTVEVNKDQNVFKPATRHLLLEFDDPFSSLDILNLWLSRSQPLLRTFIKTNMWREQLIQGLTFRNLKCLRVLDLSHTDINTLHISICNLKHLRYLDLSCCQHLRSLPDESICNLRNLLVLKLNYCTKLQALPKSIRKLTNLRHLGIEGCDELRRMPVGMGKLSCLRTLSMFIVVPKSGCGIGELEGLDHLRGTLEIKGLQHVKDLKESRKANLMRKKSLHELKLFWSEENNDNMDVGEGLKPHPNIRGLDINYYNGLEFPSWMSHSCLPNLVEISLVGCKRCEHLPPLGGLAFLEILKISEMDSVKCIGDEFYGDHHHHHHLQGSSSSLFFPSLRKLEICKMPNLEEWYAPSSSKEEGEELPAAFPSLKGLKLEGCPKLRTLPTTLLSDLRELTLGGGECNEMMLESSSLVKVIGGCLQKLEIKSFNKIETLPKVLLENLPSTLTELRFDDCKELVCLSGVMQNLTSLRSFHIWKCPSLKYLPELGNSYLTIFMIKDCPELEFLPDDFQDLTYLRSLHIAFLPQMTCLTEGLQQVAGTLGYLRISSCSGLTSLPDWMDKFTSLQNLIIQDSENLKVLPEEVLHLPSLKEVLIIDCHPDLHRRYAKETGEDWHKIAHVPKLTILESREWKIRHRSGKMKMKCINYNNNNSITSCFSSSSGTKQ